LFDAGGPCIQVQSSASAPDVPNGPEDFIDITDTLPSVQITRLVSAHTTLSAYSRGQIKSVPAIRRLLTCLEVQCFLAVFIIVDAHRVLLEIVFEIIGGRLRDAAIIIFYWSNVAPLFVYSLDISLKLLVFGLRNYCRRVWNIYDLIFVLGPTLLYQVLFSFEMERGRRAERAGLAVLGLHLAVIPSIWGRMRPLTMAAKNKVSQNKMRFVDITENIDLDLTYISGFLIAMGVPCTDFKRKLYRNPLNDVVRFFKARHESQFRIYNACPELPYPVAPFEAIGGSIVQFQVLDHTPPTMNQFVQFLTDARQWRSEDEQNVIAVHCKGGKGRTGSLCAAWLLYSREADTAEEALTTFARRRTDISLGRKLRGVETPSQVRYVFQLSHYLRRTGCFLDSTSPLPRLVATTAVRLHSLDLEEGLIARPERLKTLSVLVHRGDGVLELALESPAFESDVKSMPLGGVIVAGDVRISVFENGHRIPRTPPTPSGNLSHHEVLTCAKNPYKAKGLVFCFLFHTNFLEVDCRTSEIQDSSEMSSPDQQRSKRFRVEDLDKAHQRVRSGEHASGSGVVLRFSDNDDMGKPLSEQAVSLDLAVDAL
jgi:protein-tyrosine phosphatase